MNFIKETIQIRTSGKGLYEFTSEIESILTTYQNNDGLCHLFIQHTSASLIISENADPTAKDDLEQFINRLAPDGEDWHKHTLEGKDDSTSHMKSIITNVDLTIPIDSGRLELGIWQGLYLFEHRNFPHTRNILVRIQLFE